MLDQAEKKTLLEIRAVLESGCTDGVSLTDFLLSPLFSDHFHGVTIPLLNNYVPVRPGSSLAETVVIKQREGAGKDLFEIRLSPSIDLFPADGPAVTNRNRNITIYKALLIHEAAHILEGSFLPLNLEDIFEELGNAELARRILGCLEDFRVEANLIARFMHRKDYGLCLDFLNLVMIGLKGKYRGDDQEDFICALQRKIMCGKTLAELVSRDPAKRLAINGSYGSLDELTGKEQDFFAKPTVPELKAKGISNYLELTNHLYSEVKGLALGSIVDSIRMLRRFYPLLRLQFPQWADKENNTMPAASVRAAHDFNRGPVKPDSLEHLLSIEDEVLAGIKKIASDLCIDYTEAGEPGGFSQSEPEGGVVFGYGKWGLQSVPFKVNYQRLEQGDPRFVHMIRRYYPTLISSITEQFEELKLNRLQVKRMQGIPESFNPVGVVYASIDPKFAREQRYYDASVRNRRDYAIYYLIDASGSTSANIVPFQADLLDPKKDMKVLDIEKIAAAAIYTAIEDLELKGSFTQRLYMYQSKNETDIYEAKDVSCLTGLDSHYANRDGAAIRSIAERLLMEPKKTRILFIFADGMPSDSNYENALYDSGMAIKEAADTGILVFYMLTRNSTDLTGDERSRFGKLTAYATDRKIVSDPSDLPYKTRDIFSQHLI